MATVKIWKLCCRSEPRGVFSPVAPLSIVSGMDWVRGRSLESSQIERGFPQEHRTSRNPSAAKDSAVLPWQLWQKEHKVDPEDIQSSRLRPADAPQKLWYSLHNCGWCTEIYSSVPAQTLVSLLQNLDSVFRHNLGIGKSAFQVIWEESIATVSG